MSQWLFSREGRDGRDILRKQAALLVLVHEAAERGEAEDLQDSAVAVELEVHAEGVDPFDFDAADGAEGLVAHEGYDNPFGRWSDFGSSAEGEVWDDLAKSAEQEM